MIHTDNVNPDRLKDILSKESGERVICQFLKEHPSLVYWTFCLTGGHVNYVFSEFTVGNQYKADFVILHTYSGAFEAHFIELEPIRDPIFSKNKKPSKRLSDAIKQIDEWKEYAKGNKPSLRQDLIRWAKNKDLLNKREGHIDPANYAEEILADPSTGLFFSFHVIIGMREDITKEKRELKNMYRNNHNIEIGSYDRFLDTAKNLYGQSKSY